MDTENTCFVCDNIQLDELKEKYNNSQLQLCEKHSQPHYAQLYCLSCRELYGVDPFFLSLMTGISDYFTDPNSAAGAVLIIPQSCPLCNSNDTIEDSEYYLVRSANYGEFKQPQFVEQSEVVN